MTAPASLSKAIQGHEAATTPSPTLFVSPPLLPNPITTAINPKKHWSELDESSVAGHKK